MVRTPDELQDLEIHVLGSELTMTPTVSIADITALIGSVANTQNLLAQLPSPPGKAN